MFVHPSEGQCQFGHCESKVNVYFRVVLSEVFESFASKGDVTSEVENAFSWIYRQLLQAIVQVVQGILIACDGKCVVKEYLFIGDNEDLHKAA